MAITITRQDAKDTLAWLTQANGNPAVAAHDVEVQIVAIRPYTARPLVQAYRVLRAAAARDEEARATFLAKLRAIAEGDAD